MRNQNRLAGMAGAALCCLALAFGQEGGPASQTSKKAAKPRLSQKQRDQANARLAAQLIEARELRGKATEITKAIGELASSGKLPQDQEGIDQMKKMVDELAQINQRLQKIEGDVAGIHGWIEGQNEALPILTQDVSDLKRHKWGNYIQFQYLDDKRPGNFDSFRMRRARVGFTETIDPRTSIKVSLDLAATQFGSTINEPAESVAQLRDAFMVYKVVPSDVHIGTLARAGRQPLSLGYEIERSSSEREFPERTVYNQTLFPGERSTGLLIRHGLSPNSLVNVGGFNALTFNDPQQRTSGPSPGNRLGMLVGIRHYSKRHDIGLSGFKGKRETIRSGGATPVVNPAFDREFIYLDGTYIGLLDPKLFLRAEAMQGTERLNAAGALSGSATADNTKRDVRGHQIHLGYNINSRNQVNLRYEQFDRNVDTDGDAISGWALSYLHYLNPNVRLMAALEKFDDPLRSTKQKYQLTTLRVQFRF